MNQNGLFAKWNEMKGKARQRWTKLTNEDLDVIQGKQDQLVVKVEQRYNLSRGEAEQQVRDWVEENTMEPVRRRDSHR